MKKEEKSDRIKFSVNLFYVEEIAMNSSFQNLIDLDDRPREWWDKIISLGSAIKDNPKEYAKKCEGKILATLFYEPSTRTQMSFQTAMLRLGGTLIGFDNPETSSVAKGENLKDTTKIVSSYADIMVMRNPLEGSAKAASLTADCPIINAGDGGHLHPTQTLTDLLTLSREKGRLTGLTVGLCGDLKNGRTVHSLCKALSRYPDNRFVFISTDELAMPNYVKEILDSRNCPYEEIPSLDDAIGNLDVLYMTRVQQERFSSMEEYERLKNVYCLDNDKLAKAKSDLIVLHPLPRLDEIPVNTDHDPRTKFFEQAKYGMYVRMALILTMIEESENPVPQQMLKGHVCDELTCTNPKCITHKEDYLPKSYIETDKEYICEFCDERIAK